MKIAVCDNEQIYIDSIKAAIDKYVGCKKGEDKDIFRIETFMSGEALLQSDMDYDIFFLDIEMEDGMDGLQTAQLIRAQGIDTPVVYVTGYEKYWRRAYRVHAFDYLTKPIKYEDVVRILDELYRRAEKYSDEKLEFTGLNGQIYVSANDIVYLMISGRRDVVLRTGQREIRIKGSLADIYAQLNPRQFVMTHRTCIVNMKYVTGVENLYDIIMSTGEFCPLAQRKKKEFLKALSDYAL